MALIALAPLGCGSDVDARAFGPWAGNCERVASVMAEPHACRRDDECPCGTGCALGQCVASCSENAECGEGAVCDAFGRCTMPEHANRPIPPGAASWRGPRRVGDAADTPDPSAQLDALVPLSAGVVAVDRTGLELLAADAVASFRVSTTGSAIARVRVAAQGGVAVACDGGGAFGAECFIGPLEPGAVPSEVRVRADGPWPAGDERGSVSVFAGTTSREIGVLKKGAPPSAAIARDGFYEGTAWLVGAGLTARTVEDRLPAELARLKLSVKAKVFPGENGKYTVAFDEPRHAVFPRGAVGTLSVSPGSTTWDLLVPSRQYLGDDVDAPASMALDVHATETMTGATFRDGVLLGDVVTRFEGVTTAEYAPFVRWRLSLSRSGALEAGERAPVVVTRPVASVADRARAPFAEEAGLASIPSFGELAPLERAVSAWCTPSGAGAAVTGLATGTDRRGDLLCSGGGTTQLAFATTLGTLLDRGDYVDDCVRAFDPASTAWGEVSGSAPCANRARAVSVMATALATDRGRALGTESTPNLPMSRLGSRALQLWLGAQSITGADPTRLAVLGPLLPGGTDVDKLRFYAKYDNAFEALQRSIGAWDVLLHPRIGAALAAMPPQALEQPDYRVGFPGTGFAGTGGEQSVGLPVNIVAALTSQLAGVTGLVDALSNQRITGREANRYAAEVANFMPRSVVLFAMAQGLRDAARSNGPEPWENTWVAVRAKYGSALAKLSEDLRALESNRNPLGIEDGDLPLYRLGEQQGAHGRFSAVSDSLLGREDSADPAIAPVLLDRAREAELSARAALSAVLARDYESELQAAATSRNMEAIKRYYGEQVTSLCGFDHLDATSVLDVPELVDANTCFLTPACLPSPEQAAARSSRIEQAHQVCLYGKYRRVLGDAITTFDGELDRAIDALEPSFVAGQPLPALPADVVTRLLTPKRPEGGLRLPEGIDFSNILAARTLCDSARDATLVERPQRAPAQCVSTDDCPVAMICDGAVGRCAAPEDASEACFQGSLGGQLLAVRAAATELAIAVDEFDDYAKRYAGASRSCALLEKSATRAAQLNEDLDKTVSGLERAKLAMDIVEKTSSVVREIASTVSMDPIKAASLGVQIAAGAVETTAFAISAGLQVAIDGAVGAHADAIDKLDRETEVAICMNEAGMELIGASAAQKRVTRQEQELRALLYEFAAMQGGVTSAIDEGLASLASERARAVLPSNADYWLDADIDLFEQRMRRARRALYLAILGVEYEFQQTSAERANVLAAQTTAELEAILGRVRDGVRRGAPQGGGNPTELRSVLSLRKNILQLANRETIPDGWHKLDDVARFQHLLVSPEFAVYDDAGSYQGQEIPFSLAPIGSTGLADPSGVPLFSGLSCAERLWAVNATVLGRDLMAGSDTGMTSLQVRKRNTFESQWCSREHGTPSQLASTRAGVNLFVDPLSASSWTRDATLASLTSVGDAATFSFATVQARLNVDQKTLESNAFGDGASTALAGRGAFGEYTLFIPRTSLAMSGGAGLALENVEDILIRLDYVAAERQ